MKARSVLNLKVFIIACLYTLNGCSQDSVQVATIYDGCCGTEPKVYEIEDYKVYIPNIITPNGDGINDAFYPICNKMDPEKFSVIRYYIYDDTTKLIFAREGLSITDPEGWGFRGLAWTQPHKPQITKRYDYTGKFKYSFTLVFLLNDGTIHLQEVEGEACVVRCDLDAKVLIDKVGCHFPIQGQGGVFNVNAPNNEEHCIK